MVKKNGGTMHRTGFSPSLGGGGGANTPKVFIDTTNMLYTTSSADDVEYTAVENCYLITSLTASGNQSEKVFINDVDVSSLYELTTNPSSMTVMIPVAKGDTVKVTRIWNNAQPFTIYGMK